MNDVSIDLAPYIDHTLLKPEATPDQVRSLCAEAARYAFRTVCVNSRYAALAAAELAQSSAQVCCVVGFPLGAMHSDAKAFEARTAIADGAREIDMVIAIGAALAGEWGAVRSDIEAVYRACDGVPLKVIFETCQLSDDQIRTLCQVCTEVGVAFVKTSTGFGSGGATLEQVHLMAESVGEGVQVKASGGIRDRAAALAMIDAGATRLGTSSGVAIVQGQAGDADY